MYFTAWRRQPRESTHHNASAQVFADGEGGCRFVWITDVLPHDLRGTIDRLMEQGIQVIKETLEAQPGPTFAGSLPA